MRRATVLAIALGACDGGGKGGGLSFAEDVQPIFADAGCASCHNDADADGDGVLDDVNGDGIADRVPTRPYLDKDPLAATIGVPSNEALDMMLIEPGDSDGPRCTIHGDDCSLYSYLWHKLNGSQSLAGGSGTSMPLGSSLTEAEIQLIGEWIDEGATP
jgi:hypothetical protein